MEFSCELTKDTDAPVFQLPLAKNEDFRITMMWDGAGDIDLHALVCVNKGQGAKLTAWPDILSTYNKAHMSVHADMTFSTHQGALIHSPDARNGNQTGIDEYIDMFPSKFPVTPAGSVREVPLIATIHTPKGENPITFRSLTNARAVISRMDGTQLMEVKLTEQFADSTGVQMGTIMIDQDGRPQFHPIGVGFNIDFNGVLKHFS